MNATPADRASLQARIADLLAEHSTLTLATVSPDGVPSAAAVFFAHDAGLNLYFLSEAQSEHGRNLEDRPDVAATVQADEQDWRKIRGLQLRGVAAPVSGAELAHAATVYGRKYAFVASLLAGGAGLGVLAGPLARARFYVLRVRWLRLIDNTVQFGYREDLHLANAPGPVRPGKIRTIVIGVFEHAGRMLVFEGHDPFKGETFYRPLGGGIEFGERGEEALRREMKEEIGADVIDLRYVATLENLFVHLNRPWHEIVLVYRGAFRDRSLYGQAEIVGYEDNAEPLRVLWKPLSDFGEGKDILYPAGLFELLSRARAD